MASAALFQALAEALGKPSKTFRAVQEGLDIPNQAMKGYEAGSTLGDQITQRRLENQTLEEALGVAAPPGSENVTVRQAQNLAKPMEAYASFVKAQKEATRKGLQFVGTQSTKEGNKGVLFDPNTGTVSNIPMTGDEPILPKTVTPTVSPYADSSGQPLVYTPGRGLNPASSNGSGTPVLKQGNEQAIGDVALMQTQAPNIDKLFDAYAKKNPSMAKIQATQAGSLLDPETKQLENSLKLSAFTFGGKNLTGQEKQVVFGAFFPSWTDNPASLEQKRSLLKDYFSGKVDLLQAANLLGPAGAPLSRLLQQKSQSNPQQSSNTPQSTGDPEADAAIARINAANIDPAQKQARIKAVLSRVGK